MTVQRVLTALAERVPRSLKRVLLGKRGSPRRIANVIHAVLNRAPGEAYPILDCSGPLRGYRMRVNWTKHRSFAYGTWEPEVTEAILKSVARGMCAIDIGAHAGFYTLLLSKLVGADGKVIAFEPLPANLRMLNENMAINGIQNVKVEALAVSSSSGEVDLEVPGVEEFALAGPLQDTEDPRLAHVASTSLDEYLVGSATRIDFIKMDVEGAEGEVLKGAKRLLEAYRPTMMIELHNVGEAEQHPVYLQLKQMGYSVSWLGECGYTAHVVVEWSRTSARSKAESSTARC